MSQKETTYIFTPLQFKGVLDDFAALVKHKVYKKFDYLVWRDFQAHIKNNEKDNFVVTIIDNNEAIVETPRLCEGFDLKDNSFGEFLDNNCYEHWHGCKIDSSFPFNFGSSTGTTATLGTIATSASSATYAIANTANHAVNTFKELADLYSVSTSTTASTTYNINNTTKEENKTMYFNFDFGPYNNSTVKMSLYGIAVKNQNGTYVAYDKSTGRIMDVDILNFNGGKYLYKLPCAIKDVKVGDVVIHNSRPVIVTAVNGNVLTAVDITVNEQKDIIPTRNMFNFDYVTKVVSLFDFVGGFKADPNNPFGNALPLLMMGDSSNSNDMLPMMLMMNGGKMDFTSNPMLMYFMFKDGGKGNDMLPLMMLAAGGNNPFAPAVEAKPEPAVVNTTLTIDEDYIRDTVVKILNSWASDKSDNA